MNVTNSDGTVTRLEGQAAIDKFNATDGPCELIVGRSTRRKFVQRHRGEGIRAMILRLQGIRG